MGILSSRTDGVAVIAICDRSVGVDVERNHTLPREIRDHLDRALRQIRTRLARIDGPANDSTDIRSWTWLEAFIKLEDGRLGTGLADWATNDVADWQRLATKEGGARDWPLTAWAVPVPSGNTSTCCLQGRLGESNAGPFRLSEDAPAAASRW